MTDIRRNIYEKRKLISAMVSAAGTFIENPVDEKTWSEVEKVRKELDVIKDRVVAYLDEVDNYITDQSKDWQEQWDLAYEIYQQESEKEHTADLDQLTQHLEKRGLNNELASAIANQLLSGDEEE